MGSADPAILTPLVDMQAEYAQHGTAISHAVYTVMQSGAFIMGPQVFTLEQKLAAYVNPSTDPSNESEHPPVQCVAVSDGTAALHLSLLALGVSNAHEVITVPFTWISSAEVIPLVGAKPVFADVEKDTFVMDPEKLAILITPKTRAVITVSLFGLIPDLHRIRHILDQAEMKFGTHIALIEDGAQSFGSLRHGWRSCGSPHATMSTTSFFPTKPLSCYGDGGAVFTRDHKLAASVRALRVHGKINGKHELIGMNARLDTLQAAILLVKFDMFDDLLAARRKAAERYTRMLQDDDRVVLPTYLRVVQGDAARCVYGIYTVLVEERDAILKRMKESGISCAVYYKVCCHQQPVFAKFGRVEGMDEAESLSRKALALPMHAYLTEDVQVRVVRELRTALDDLKVTDAPR